LFTLIGIVPLDSRKMIETAKAGSVMLYSNNNFSKQKKEK